MSTETRLLLAELRAARPAALRRLRAALRRSGGSVTAAAADLGLHLPRLYELRRTVPEVAAALAELGLGTEGALARARAAKTRASSRGSEKSTRAAKKVP